MEPLTPIPTPAEHQWREFRIKRIPVIFFGVALLAIAFIWKNHVVAPSVVGEVESIRADIISTLPGQILELNVEPFQRVTNGQIIAKVTPTDPAALQAALVAVQMELKVLRARMLSDQQRNSLNYEQIWLDLLTLRTELATAKVNLQFAENEYQRHLKLRDEKIVSDSVLEFYKDIRDVREKEISEKTIVLAEMETRLKEMAASNDRAAAEDQLLTQAIAAQEASLILAEGPVILRSPIDGTVGQIAQQVGSRIMAGIPITSISPAKSTRIIGYLRQPVAKVPQPGDAVQVRTRTSPRRHALATVLQVGSEFQPVAAPMWIRSESTNQVRGLPFLVNVPQGFEVYPGELVELVLR